MTPTALLDNYRRKHARASELFRSTWRSDLDDEALRAAAEVGLEVYIVGYGLDALRQGLPIRPSLEAVLDAWYALTDGRLTMSASTAWRRIEKHTLDVGEVSQAQVDYWARRRSA